MNRDATDDQSNVAVTAVWSSSVSMLVKIWTVPCILVVTPGKRFAEATGVVVWHQAGCQTDR